MIPLNIRLLIVLLITLVLSILPMPSLLAGVRPPWVLMLILYIQFFLPGYFSVFLIFFTGLCLDVLLSTVIGEHGFALLFTTWLISGKARRFNFFSMGQQMAVVGVFCFLYQLIIIVVDVLLGYQYGVWMAVGSALSSMLFWPWIKLLADDALLKKLAYR